MLKDGIHQFMLQEGLVDVYRTEAVLFLKAAAEWVDAQDSTLDSLTGTATKATKVVGMPGACDHVDMTASKAGVGLMEVIANLWRQRK